MTSLIITILAVLVVVGSFLAYWSGRQDGQKQEFEKSLKEAEIQRQKILDLTRQNEKLRRERQYYADEVARFWSVTANQKRGDYIE